MHDNSTPSSVLPPSKLADDFHVSVSITDQICFITSNNEMLNELAKGFAAHIAYPRVPLAQNSHCLLHSLPPTELLCHSTLASARQGLLGLDGLGLEYTLIMLHECAAVILDLPRRNAWVKLLNVGF